MNSLIIKIIGGVLGSLATVGLLIGGFVALTNHFTSIGVLQKENADQAAYIEQVEKARVEDQRITEEAQARERKALQKANDYRSRLAAASDACLDMPVAPALDRLLTEITNPGGLEGLSTSAGVAIKDAADTAVEKWRDVSGFRGPRDRR